MTAPFERIESNVRSYSRAFPAVFERAHGAVLYDEAGREYIDFFAGAGVMNYGHNNRSVNQALVRYLSGNGILHSLDMFTRAKRTFLQSLDSIILRPRGLQYKVQFCGPTGTNAIEAALKLVRQTKQRRTVVAFTNAYHGLTMGALPLTGNVHYKNEFYAQNGDAVFMPYDGYLGEDVDTAEVLRAYLTDKSSGLSRPAAIFLETIQAEGGVNVASVEWLRKIAGICQEFDILLVVDDIQVGNGRSGHFFSFERAGIAPDVVALSKAIGAGMPMSILLIRPDLDTWIPGQHTGTFRGNNLAFVAGAEALQYWKTSEFEERIQEKGRYLAALLEGVAFRFPQLISEIRGCGLIYGLVIPQEGLAARISRRAFELGVVIEVAGSRDHVLKFLPPLTIDESTLARGMGIIARAVEETAQGVARQAGETGLVTSQSAEAVEVVAARTSANP